MKMDRQTWYYLFLFAVVIVTCQIRIGTAQRETKSVKLELTEYKVESSLKSDMINDIIDATILLDSAENLVIDHAIAPLSKKTYVEKDTNLRKQYNYLRVLGRMKMLDARKVFRKIKRH